MKGRITRLERRHLEMVRAIHDRGRVTAAARDLHITQPALSHALSKLEDRLGFRLFDRTSEGMRLTEEGTRVLESADRVLPEMERLEHDLDRLGSGYRGTIRIATECYTCYYWLPSLLERFREEFPRVDLQIVPEATHDPVEALDDRAIDVAILHGRPRNSKLALRDLFRDELVAVVPPRHPWAAKAWVEPEDFAGETVLVHSRPEESALFVEFLVPAGVEVGPVHELQLTEAVLESAAAGLGVSVLGRWVAARALEDGRLEAVRLSEEGFHRTWYAAYRAERGSRLPLERFVDHLEAVDLAGGREPVGSPAPGGAS